jgi:hypothetical protein
MLPLDEYATAARDRLSRRGGANSLLGARRPSRSQMPPNVMLCPFCSIAHSCRACRAPAPTLPEMAARAVAAPRRPQARPTSVDPETPWIQSTSEWKTEEWRGTPAPY